MNFLNGKINSVSKLKVSVELDALGKLSMKRNQFSKELSVGSVELGIRPEMLVIGKINRKETNNTIQARIDEISFFGDYIQYKIKLLAGNATLLVSEMHSRGGIEWKLNDHVSVSWTTDSFVPLK